MRVYAKLIKCIFCSKRANFKLICNISKISNTSKKTKRMSCSVIVKKADYNRVINLFELIRAKPTIYVATEDPDYSAGAIVQHNARAIERVWQAAQGGDAAALTQARAIADLEIAQAQGIVFRLVLDASTELFDALGASSTLAPLALDRFWRNVRTLATHNPSIYKTRIAGDFAVNGTSAPDQWAIGVVRPVLKAVA